MRVDSTGARSDGASIGQIDHYSLLEALGHGGMGVVYRARDRRLGRQVALKVLPSDVQTDPVRRGRLIREARAAAAVHHPNLATLFELGESESEVPSRLYLVMELVDGEELEAVLARGPLPPLRALDVAAQIAGGLEAAHRAGVVHRDLKPRNIKIDQGGTVKLLDLGLAKMREQDDLVETQAGLALGTVPYMPPEQCRGRGVDARADLFALGVVLHRMLTGTFPFPAGNLVEHLEAVEGGARRPLQGEIGALAGGIDSLLERLLAAAPADRPESAAAVRAELLALRGVATGERSRPEDPTWFLPTGAVARPRRARSAVPRWLWPALALAAVAVGVMLALMVRERGGRAGDRIAVLPLVNMTGDPGLDYLAPGLGAGLTSQLAGAGMSVVAHDLVAGYATSTLEGRRRLVRDHALRLLVGGTLRLKGAGLLVNVSVVDAGGVVRWASDVEAPLDRPDVLEGGMVRGLLAQLAPPGAASPRTGEPRDGRGYREYLKAQQFLESGTEDRRVARFYLGQALELDPNLVPALVAMAELLVAENEAGRGDAGDLKAALEFAERAVAQASRSYEALVARGRARRAVGMLAESAEDLERAGEVGGLVVRRPDQPPTNGPAAAKREMAQTLADTGKFEQARQAFEEAVRADAGDWETWEAFGEFWLRHDRLDEARAAFARAHQLAPAERVPRENLAVVELFRGQPQAAIDVYGALEGPLSNARVASNIGTAHYMLGHLDEARQLYQLAVQLEPGDELLRGNLGDVLLEVGRENEARYQYRAAVSLLEQKLEAVPTHPSWRLRLARFQAKAGSCAESLRLARSLEDELPATPGTSFELARVFASCDQAGEAREHLVRAIRAGLAAGQVQAANELSALRNDPEIVALLSRGG